MNKLLSSLKKQSNHTTTENGALTYRSSLSECLDLFFKAGGMRNIDEVNIEKAFVQAFVEDRDTAMKILFYTRDIRGGLGERRFFRTVIRYLASFSPESVEKNLKYFPEYGRWDDLFVLLELPSFRRKVTDMVEYQLYSDIQCMKENKPVSLLAKWMPSVNTSSEKTRRLARLLREGLGMNEKNYRQTLSSLRKYIDILESRLCEKDYTFDYSVQPSRAMLCYKKAFIRNDKERYIKYLESVRNGTSKMNTSTLYPYDIVRAVSERRELTKEERLSLDTSWKALNDIENSQNAIAVVDGSGSMYMRGEFSPINAAVALGIYFAEHSKGAFANHFITFSETPRLVELKGRDIAEKVKYAMSYNEIANTNLQNVFKLILSSAVKKKLPQSELPETIYIISDMEFDYCVTIDGKPATNFDAARKMFEANGYKLPNVVFWNVNSRSSQIPVKMHESGAALVSGQTPKIFDMVRSGEIGPMSIMTEIINS